MPDLERNQIRGEQGGKRPSRAVTACRISVIRLTTKLLRQGNLYKLSLLFTLLFFVCSKVNLSNDARILSSKSKSPVLRAKARLKRQIPPREFFFSLGSVDLCRKS